jgi:hypothetical protein
MRASRGWTTLVVLALACTTAMGQNSAKHDTVGQVLRITTSNATGEVLLQGLAANWSQAAAKQVALNRTPPLYDTDEPAAEDIRIVEVRMLRAGGKLFAQLTWRDSTHDAAALQAIPGSAPETRFLKVPTEANDRFFDAAAMMVPLKEGTEVNPSLQMGDADHPVQIYYWNSSRGAMLMEAQGRGTTKRLGSSFPCNSFYRDGVWTVTFELPAQHASTPVAFAIWNGAQKDRDGRKYFSVWYTLE